MALVSVPLSTALAIASGCQPMKGLSAGIYGPLMGGLFGGSNYNILGPAGALVNLLNKYSTENGPEIVPLLAFFAGVFTLLVWILKLEKYCMLIPVSVLEGFSFSVAIAIGFGQFNFALGIKGLPKHKEFYNNVIETFSSLDKAASKEFVPFLVLLVLLWSLLKFKPGKPWIVMIAFIGMAYGFITATWFPSIKPFILKEAYPTMNDPQIVDFTYT